MIIVTNIAVSRRYACIFTDIFSIFSIGLCMISVPMQKSSLLLVGRFLCGVNVGINSVVIPIYIKEMVPDVNKMETSFNNTMPIYTK